jgi:hypothetical protein
MKWPLFVYVFIFFGESIAQENQRKDFDPSSLVDEIFAMQDLNISYQDLYENYLQLLSNPYDLNKVSEEQLQALYVLDRGQINALLRYRDQAGPFLSIYELQNIPNFSIDLIQKISPFFTVANPTTSLNETILNRILKNENNYLILRWARTLESQKGYLAGTDSSGRYAGSPDQMYSRFRTSKPGDFSLGFTLEKDAGEAWQWNPAKKYYAFDYVSYHAQVLNKGKIKNVIIGDYQAQFGQGIALGSVFGIGKNGEAVTTVRRSNLGFSPYTSLYEAGYFRGAAVSYEVSKNLLVHAMYSLRSRDASVNQDTAQSVLGVATSFSFTGLHRTPRELAGRNSIGEQNLAAVLNFKNSKVDAGVLVHQTNFSTSLLRESTPYNQFFFNGNQNINFGGFFNYHLQNISFFSEWTRTIGNGNAMVAGLMASLTNKLDVVLHYRNFSRDFYSFYSNAFAENSTPQNERGIYWGWKYTFNKKYSIAGYADTFGFPWLKFRSYSPSEGTEWLLRFNYKPSKTVALFVQYREETKQRNSSDETNLYQTGLGTRRNYWFNADYSTNMYLSFKSRIQWSTFDFDGHATQGMVVLQDVTYRQGRFSISGRYAFFDTDNFDNRLYVYEKDVWLAFSFPAYNGKGTRQYLLAQCQINEKIDIWLRWSQTQYLNRDSVGTGGDTIIGNTENDVKFQVRLRL